jgi:hypothetical protein
LDRGQQILLAEVATLHHVLQRFGGPRRGGKTGGQQQRGGFHCKFFHLDFSHDYQKSELPFPHSPPATKCHCDNLPHTVCLAVCERIDVC